MFPLGTGRKNRSCKINALNIIKFATGDSADYQNGIIPIYNILTTGQYSGTVNLDVANYAAPTIAFVSATKKIIDTSNGLITVLTGDTIVIWGSVSNNGVYTVATGGVAGEIVTTEALLDEAAGAYVTILKRAVHSNNVVHDKNTNFDWMRYVSVPEKLGVASNGLLTWWSAVTNYSLHAAANDLRMNATTKILTIIGGASEVTRYKTGTHIIFSGFTNASNNIDGGFRVDGVTVNGADLDITLWPGYRNTLVTEAEGGSRTIKLVTNNCFSYAAAANAVALGGYTDWRIPDDIDLVTIRKEGYLPDTTAFPSWSLNSYTWSSCTLAGDGSRTLAVYFRYGVLERILKTGTNCVALLRG